MSFDVVDTKEIAAISVEVKAASKVNFASSQNGVSILQDLTLTNTGVDTLENIRVTAECVPGLIRPKAWTLDRLSPGDARSLPDLDTPLDTALLGGLNEAERGHLSVTVRCDDAVICEETVPIELLARDEWGGLGAMAPLLAAFVAPNDPVVPSVLKEAARLLEATGQSGAIDGYQSRDPGRVWMLAGAIWSAATAMGLSYAVPPASFEQRGQKVRDPGRIRAEGLATCLDSSLLLAACFEAAGLNPVVLFSEGHAWTGVWLQDRDFGALSEPDVVTIRKAVEAREFVMMETTLLTKRPAVGFEEAVMQGRDHTEERNEHTFLAAIDIRRARAARIRPMASHTPPPGAQTDDIPASAAALPKPLDLGVLPGELIEDVPATPADRISRWQRKLLDLSLRNRLLNFRDSKQTLPLLCPEISALEDQLAGGKKFKTLALKEDDPIAGRDLLVKDGPRVLDEVARDAFAKGQVAFPLTRKETDKRLLDLHRRAKSDMQEGGTNTLFLAAGFLRWKKSETDTRIYRAPLLLIPVKVSRRSAQSEFMIEHHEDDVRFNATLLEFLKRDFDLTVPELDGDLPRDDSGFDLPRIFEIMRRRVRNVAGFEVVEDLALSTFSFAKFLMWKDLVDRTDGLRESALVKHLVDNPTEAFLPEGSHGLPKPVDVDRRIAPKDLFTPLPADSSQLAAVLAAQDGHDFVLIGPPGTGKSQTIANIISQCLGVGKTVLFVAEKAAALDVVQRRLSAHGLGDAVLELHSSKADRKSVLTQLGCSWARGARGTQRDWIRITDDLTVTREQLNTYVAALHRKGSQGFSVFQAVGRVAGHAQPFALSFDNKDAHDHDSYARLRTLSEDLARCHEIIDGKPALPLVRADDWSFGWQADLLARTESLATATHALASAAEALAQMAGLQAEPTGAPTTLAVLQGMVDIPDAGPDLSWALAQNMTAITQNVETLTDLLGQYHAACTATAATYPMDRLDAVPLAQLDTSWRVAHSKMWPFSIFAKASLRKLLQTYATGGKADPARDIAALTDARAARIAIDALPLTGCPVFSGIDTDTTELAAWVHEAQTLRDALDALSGFVADAQTWDAATHALATRTPGPLRDAITLFRERLAAWRVQRDGFQRVANCDPQGWALAEWRSALDDILVHRDHLLDWTRWVAIREQADAVGLRPLIDALEQGTLDTPAEAAFDAAYAAWWLPLAMDADDALRGFSHWEHEDAIQQFRDLDTRATELAADQVLHRIQHGLPAQDAVPKRSELGTLRHQLNLKRPSKPIRTLISEMPETFTKLAPCVLMSPLSVAQYLPAGQAAFDVVIFDEASQITTWDAIGAIARGRQAIIVGDPKQLPPTNFFGRADSDDEDLPESERDLASILDEVASAGIPTQQLDWHYRSRDESLIAFSNWHYYGGRLVTFPSPATDSDAVQLHQIDGVYGRGRGRTNEAEARAIVRMTIQRLNDWLTWPEEDRLTLGVITFNAEQQGLILDLLDEERRNNPDLEWFFEDAREEPVIVKNLENIQGDERDVMLFSITFGPDHAGKLSMAFGALNSDGGEKRLNVAVTRARRELHVFASIRADQIDLSRTKALGVKHLKGFLDYAGRGHVALPAQDDGSLGPVENPFEAAIKAAIEAKGWELRPQIGVSGFRIDLGVIHPDHAGVYLAGIECDGATYHGSASARDRDKVRQGVLENLGWTILRIWSTDWFRNPKTVIDRIHDSLLAQLDADRAQRAAKETDKTASNAAQPEPEEAPAPDDPPHTDAPEPAQAAGSERAEPFFERAQTPNGHVGTDPQPDPDRFYDAAYIPVLESLIAQIVEDDGPLPLSQLCRRVAALHGWQRTGRRIAEQVGQSLARVEQHAEDEVTFLWARGSYQDRIAFRADLDRNIRDVSRTEIAALYDLNADTLAQSEDPVLELARLAGISRLSSDARAYLETSLAWRAG